MTRSFADGLPVPRLYPPPTRPGKVGRPSRSFTLEQSLVLLEAARKSRLNAYAVLSLSVGIRTQEARELHWDHVDLDGDPGAPRAVLPTVAVWHSVRRGGDTKTAKSRRTLALPQAAVQALREHWKQQAEDRPTAGALWQDHGVVFTSAIGTTLDAANVRREFCKITEAGGAWHRLGPMHYTAIPAGLLLTGWLTGHPIGRVPGSVVSNVQREGGQHPSGQGM